MGKKQKERDELRRIKKYQDEQYRVNKEAEALMKELNQNPRETISDKEAKRYDDRVRNLRERQDRLTKEHHALFRG